MFFSHPLSSSCMCVIVCFFHPPPVFHAHLLIRISTGWEDPHSLDSSRGHRLQKVHIRQWCVELRYCHVGSDVVWREAILGHEQSRCKFMWALEEKQPATLVQILTFPVLLDIILIPIIFISGDKCGGAGLSAPATHGLPHSTPSAHARLLGEREEPAAQIHPNRGHAG